MLCYLWIKDLSVRTNILVKSFFAAAALLTSSYSMASPISLGFERITGNNVENIASQLQAQVFNSTDAQSFLNQTIASDQILFTFANSAQIASNIAAVYFDDSSLFASQTSILNSLSGFTQFSAISWTKPNGDIKNVVLPGGNASPYHFEPTPLFGAHTDPGSPSLGVNTGTDLLGIVIQFKPSTLFNDVIAALMNDSLRIGLHVRSIGSNGESDSFVNNTLLPGNGGVTAVPLPTTVWLFLSGLIGVLGLQPRKVIG